MKSKKTLLFILVGVLAVAVAAWFAYSDHGTPSSADSEQTRKQVKNRGKKRQSLDKNKKSAKTTKPASAKRQKRTRVVDSYDGYSAPDRRLAEALDKARDTDENTAIIKAAVAALKSANVELRQDAVEALGWCGKDALPELTGMLADPNDDVRESAINNWECALAEVEDPRLRFSAALSVMGTITEADSLESISGQFCNAADEYIDAVDDEKAQNARRLEVVQQLFDIITGPKAICSKQAKEAYEDLTGYEWMGQAEAEKYLANPDDYEPPENE